MNANAIVSPRKHSLERLVSGARSAFGRLLLLIVDLVVLLIGRDVDFEEEPWLDGPSEPDDVVGPEAHLRVAKRRGLDVWEYADAGLLDRFADLSSPSFAAQPSTSSYTAR